VIGAAHLAASHREAAEWPALKGSLPLPAWQRLRASGFFRPFYQRNPDPLKKK
jgi:hypothetical protein